MGQPVQNDERPLASYGVVVSVYSGVLAAFALFMRRTGRRPPDRITTQDLAVVAMATNKVSRLVTRDRVTSPIRAPFTELEVDGAPGQAEVVEKPAGTGLRRALGELLTCPFCISQWVATAFVFGLVLAPRATRVIAGTFAALTGADFLQLGYASMERLTRE